MVQVMRGVDDPLQCTLVPWGSSPWQQRPPLPPPAPSPSVPGKSHPLRTRAFPSSLGKPAALCRSPST